MRDNELHSGSPLTDLANQNNQNQGHVTGHVVSHVGIQQPSASPILSRCMEMFELDGKVIVPFPRQLRVDKRLSHSLLISWLPPRLSGEERIMTYVQKLFFDLGTKKVDFCSESQGSK